MRTAIIGGRDFTHEEILFNELDTHVITSIVSGGARGTDTMGKKYALLNNIPYTEYLPDWDKHKKAAGIIRNRFIIDDCEKVIACHDGISRGTAFSLDYARKQGKEIITLKYEPIS